MTRRVLTATTAIAMLLAGGGYALYASEALIDERCLGPGLLCSDDASGAEEVAQLPHRAGARGDDSGPGPRSRDRSLSQREDPVTGTLLQSYRRARRILDDAVAAHGGLDALQASRQACVTLTGHEYWRNQSRRVAAPYDSAPYRITMGVDLAQERLVYDASMEYPGGARRAWRTVSDARRHVRIDHRSQTYVLAPDWPPASQQNGNLFYLPQQILLAATANVASLRYLGRQTLSSGAEVEVIATSVANGQLSLAFDPTSKLLRAIVGVGSDPVQGDIVQETEFVDWRPQSGLLLPTWRVSRAAGEVTRRLRYANATARFSMPDSQVAVPAGYAVAATAPAAEPVRSLARGVWAMGAPGPIVLVVELADGLVVVDAPSFTNAQTVERIAALAPGKPIRFVVPTHHHDDHAGGVKHFVAAGASIATTRGNRAFMEKLATTRTTLARDAVPVAPADVRIEIIDKKRVFTDGTRTLELHDIGPSPHAEEILVAWIPEEGILFQGDLLDVNAGGEILRGVNNETTLHFGEWLAAKRWTVRVFGGSHGFLRDADAFSELLRQPVIR